MSEDFNSVQGSVTLRKMRTGGTASVSLSSDHQLFQLYTKKTDGTYDYYPNWKTNPVTVTVQTAASGGQQLTVEAVTWFINNVAVATLNSAGNILFDISLVGRLVIRTNVAAPDILGLNSGILRADITATDTAGNHYNITKTETIRVQEMTESGYYVFIDASRGYVDANDSTPNAVLTARCVQNGAPVAADFDWFAGATSTTQLSTTGDKSQLTVTPSMVNGTQLFVCRAYIGGNEVDAEGVVILDKSDPCYIRASVQQYQNSSNAGAKQENVTDVLVGETNNSATVEFEVVKPDGSAYGNIYSWELTKTHAATQKLVGEIAGVDDYTESTTTEADYNHKTIMNTNKGFITVYDKDYSRLDSLLGKVVTDEVIVTATATLTAPAS